VNTHQNSEEFAGWRPWFFPFVLEGFSTLNFVSSVVFTYYRSLLLFISYYNKRHTYIVFVQIYFFMHNSCDQLSMQVLMFACIVSNHLLWFSWFRIGQILSPVRGRSDEHLLHGLSCKMVWRTCATDPKFNLSHNWYHVQTYCWCTVMTVSAASSDVRSTFELTRSSRLFRSVRREASLLCSVRVQTIKVQRVCGRAAHTTRFPALNWHNVVTRSLTRLGQISPELALVKSGRG
jgi:hypothetical protein